MCVCVSNHNSSASPNFLGSSFTVQDAHLILQEVMCMYERENRETISFYVNLFQYLHLSNHKILSMQNTCGRQSCSTLAWCYRADSVVERAAHSSPSSWAVENKVKNPSLEHASYSLCPWTRFDKMCPFPPILRYACACHNYGFPEGAEPDAQCPHCGNRLDSPLTKIVPVFPIAKQVRSYRW
jgi:hypothetical protein